MKRNKDNVTLCAMVVSEPKMNHTFNDTNYYRFDVVTVRKSGNKDHIPCIVVGSANIHVGDFIKITGRFSSYSKKNEHLFNYVYVFNIEVIEHYYSNNIELEGYICTNPNFSDHLKKGRKITQFLLASHTSVRSNYIPCFTYGIYAELTKNCKKGDFIKGIGKIESRHIDKLDSSREIVEVCFKKLEVIESESSNDKG